MMILEDDDFDSPDRAWQEDFKQLSTRAKVTSREITSVLCLLSASITNRQPLPPYLRAPRPYGFSTQLEELDKDILSIRHIADPGFAAFAVLQISTRCIVGDMERLVKYGLHFLACPIPHSEGMSLTHECMNRDVKKLVGELDFSFHAVSTANNSRCPSEAQLANPNDRDKLD